MNLIDNSRVGSFPTDVAQLKVLWMTSTNYEFEHIYPVSEEYIAVSGGEAGHGIFHLETKKMKWFYDLEFDWSSEPLVYEDYVIFPNEAAAYVHDIETGKLIKRIAYPGVDNANRAAAIILKNELIIFNTNCLYVIDLVTLKRGKKVAYSGKISEKDTAFPITQKPPYWNERFWIVTVKKGQPLLEGIALQKPAIEIELPKLAAITTSGFIYKHTYYFLATNAVVYGIDLNTGLADLAVDLTENHEIEPSSFRFCHPVLLQNKVILYIALVNNFEKIVQIDLDSSEVSNTAPTLQAMGLPTLSNVIAGQSNLYATSAWHDILQIKPDKTVQHLQIPKSDLYQLDESCFLKNRQLFVSFTHKTTIDEEQEFMNGILCIG